MANLQGNYKDSCVACLQGTDSGLSFVGEAEWIAAGLVKLGIPTTEAIILVEDGLGSDPAMVAGRLGLSFRVCQSCAEKAGFSVGLIASGKVPAYGQREA